MVSEENGEKENLKRNFWKFYRIWSLYWYCINSVFVLCKDSFFFIGEKMIKRRDARGDITNEQTNNNNNNNPNDSTAKNGQNPETSPGDLQRLAVAQTPVKDHQLTLMWKTLKEYNNNNNNNNNNSNNNNHDFVGKEIYGELYRKWKFDHTTKRYIHKAESVHENLGIFK